jgi:hypothetical protein
VASPMVEEGFGGAKKLLDVRGARRRRSDGLLGHRMMVGWEFSRGCEISECGSVEFREGLVVRGLQGFAKGSGLEDVEGDGIVFLNLLAASHPLTQRALCFLYGLTSYHPQSRAMRRKALYSRDANPCDRYTRSLCGRDDQ